MEIVHEGDINKWTNYLRGWQVRYFILDENGVLSYYLSKESVQTRTRGSIKVIACNIIVSHKDELRFDLVMPGGSRLSLRALNFADKHLWLQLIGQFKALGTESNFTATNPMPIVRSHSPIMRHSVRLKRVELGIYKENLCDQINEIKNAMADRELIDESMLAEAVKRIDVLCSAFATTLEECLEGLEAIAKESDSK